MALISLSDSCSLLEKYIGNDLTGIGSKPYYKKEVEKRICPHCNHTLGPGEIHSHNDSKKFTYGSGTFCMSLKLH